MAEQARSAVSVATTASLATVDTDGRPVVAPVPIVDDGSGQPVTVLSNLTTHTERARRDSRAAMSVAERLLLQGELVAVPGLQQLELQPRFVALHPTLTGQVESLDFSWFRLTVDRVRWTDDEDDEHWLRPEDLFGAEPDPLADLTETDLGDIADRLDDDLLLIFRSLGGRWLARSAELVHIDRYGIVALVDEPGRRSRGRVPFPERLDESDELHASLGALLRAARSSPIAQDR
ncbi:MAG: pyridoxamine 5'-phosphate oxidase family protein [Acidimicrobiales bacterium]